MIFADDKLINYHTSPPAKTRHKNRMFLIFNSFLPKCLFYWWENFLFCRLVLFPIDEMNIPSWYKKLHKKQIKLIKHTFTKLASILTHARYGGCRCPRPQGIISRKAIWSPKASRRNIHVEQTLALDAIKITIIIRHLNGEATHQTK